MESQSRTTDALLGVALGAGCGFLSSPGSFEAFSIATRDFVRGLRQVVRSRKAEPGVRKRRDEVHRNGQAGAWTWLILELKQADAAGMDMADLAVGGLLATCIGLAGAAFLFPEAFYNLTVTGTGLIQRLEEAALAQTLHLLPLK